MSQFIKFYFTSSVLNMFRALIQPSSGACDFSIVSPHWSYCSCFDVCWSFGVAGLEWYPCCRLKPATWIPLQPSHTETPTHIETRAHNQCGDTIEMFRWVLEFQCGWVGVVSVLQAEACYMDTTPTQPHRNSNTHRIKNSMTNVVIQENSCRLLMMVILMSETC